MANEQKIVYPELSYRIMSVIFEVHNKLGNRWREIDFCNAIENVLKREKIKYQREKEIQLFFEGEKFAKCRLDFIIEDKIVLEMKKVFLIGGGEIHQALRYLAATGYKLAIIASFRFKKIQYIRVINPNVK